MPPKETSDRVATNGTNKEGNEEISQTALTEKHLRLSEDYTGSDGIRTDGTDVEEGLRDYMPSEREAKKSEFT
jgi:hypothetical protein